MPSFSSRTLSIVFSLALVSPGPALVSGCTATRPLAIEEVEFHPELGIHLPSMEEAQGGIRFQDLRLGEGATVANGNRARIYYAAWLPDGTLVDGHAPPSEPLEFRVGDGEVVRGLERGILGMRPGGQRRIIIPPALGYGARAVGNVPRNAILVFVVELEGG